MIAELPLTSFELPKWLVEPAVRSCRLFNTALDFIFYGVPMLRVALAEKDGPMQIEGQLTYFNIHTTNFPGGEIRGQLVPVPGPVVGAGLPGLVAACGGLLAWWQRRRRRPDSRPEGWLVAR